MSKSKYETHVLPFLDKIERWVKAGADIKEVAGKLQIAYSTLRKYLDDGEKGDERYSALSALFARACEEPNDKVKAALYKRACGYTFTETTVEEKLDRDGFVHTLTKTVVKDVPPDTAAAMFWLTNRDPANWKYKPESGDGEDEADGGVVQLPPVMEDPGPPAKIMEMGGGGDG